MKRCGGLLGVIADAIKDLIVNQQISHLVSVRDPDRHAKRLTRAEVAEHSGRQWLPRKMLRRLLGVRARTAGLATTGPQQFGVNKHFGLPSLGKLMSGRLTRNSPLGAANPCPPWFTK
nr:hypothetical protein [Mycobacterium asiaticum]